MISCWDDETGDTSSEGDSDDKEKSYSVKKNDDEEKTLSVKSDAEEATVSVEIPEKIRIAVKQENDEDDVLEGFTELFYKYIVQLKKISLRTETNVLLSGTDCTWTQLPRNLRAAKRGLKATLEHHKVLLIQGWTYRELYLVRLDTSSDRESVIEFVMTGNCSHKVKWAKLRGPSKPKPGQIVVTWGPAPYYCVMFRVFAARVPVELTMWP